MIVKTVRGDIFNTEAKHIAFAINTEGVNDAGFAGIVARKYWPELESCGKHELGTVLSKTVGDKTFHALVCHSLRSGWGDDQTEVIRQCFDSIPADGEQVASIAIGTGLIGVLSGADFKQILCGMHDSKQEIVLHGDYSLRDVIECYNEQKGNSKRKTL